jgi:hypothetical protein
MPVNAAPVDPFHIHHPHLSSIGPVFDDSTTNYSVAPWEPSTQYFGDEDKWIFGVEPSQTAAVVAWPGWNLGDQDIQEIPPDAEFKTNPVDGITWHAQEIPYVEIQRRFDINWKTPLGCGTYGQVVEVVQFIDISK